MGKISERKKQQKRAKHNKKRKQRKQEAASRKQSNALPTSERGLVELARKGAFGPAWISEGWEDYDWRREPLLVLITRRLRGATLLPYALWVDRWLRGVEEAAVLAPIHEAELHEVAAMLGEDERRRLVPCEVPVAQSVVLHALAQADRFGLKPHRDYYPALLEPRPSPLIETFGARRERPVFTPRDESETDAMIQHIIAVIGAANVDAPSGIGGELESFFDYVLRAGPRELREARELFAIVNEYIDAQRWLPDEHAWLPGDVGDDPTRIDWRGACHECIEALRFVSSEDAFIDYDDDRPEWRLHDDIEDFERDLREGRYLAWEAQLRERQGLSLREDQAQALAEHRHLTLQRPVEPWYQTFDRMLERLTEHAPLGEDRRWLAIHGRQCIDVLIWAAPALSLPAGVASLAELLEDARVSQIRARAVVDALLELVNPHEPASLADPTQAFRIQHVAEGLETEAAHLERLGWDLEELLDPLELPACERELLLEGLRARSRAAV